MLVSFSSQKIELGTIQTLAFQIVVNRKATDKGIGVDQAHITQPGGNRVWGLDGLDLHFLPQLICVLTPAGPTYILTDKTSLKADREDCGGGSP